MKERSRNILFLPFGALATYFLIELRKEKPFQDIKNKVKKAKDKFNNG